MLQYFRNASGVGLAVVLMLAFSSCQDATSPTAPRDLSLRLTQLAASPVVNSTVDPGDGTCDDTECTLREAIAFASAGATITFAAPVAGTITLGGSALTIERNLTIAGPGASTLSVSGNHVSQVFYIYEGVTALLSGLTFTGGSGSSGGAIENEGALTIDASTVTGNTSSSDGGGIYSNGTLTVTGSIISGNAAASYGGGVSNDGTATIIGSTISGNTSRWGGGGIFHDADQTGVLTVIRSTITGNSNTDGDGGGIAAYTYDMTRTSLHTVILNSTISGNTAVGAGGGFENWGGRAALVLTTITGNHATSFGGGAHNWPTESYTVITHVKGSLIWGNTSGSSTTDDVASTAASTFNSLGYNLVGAAGANVDFSTDFSATGDQTGIASAGLGSLANNGGPTQTHALLSGSPALGTGTCSDHIGTAVSTDQRGVSRPQGSGCDVGAFESEESGGLPSPNFTFDLSGMGAKTYGDASFSVAGYANSTNSTGSKVFGLGAASVGCTVSSVGLVNLTGSATGTSYCVVSAYLASDGTYSSAGPILQSFNIAKAALMVTANDETIAWGGTPSFSLGYATFVGSDNATSLSGTPVYTFAGTGGTSYGPSTTVPTDVGTYSITPSGLSSTKYSISYAPGAFTINKAAGSVSISNMPSAPMVGQQFTPTYTKLGDGTGSTASLTPAVCSVSGDIVTFLTSGTCTLQASVTEGTNHLAAPGTGQNVTVIPATGLFSSTCSYTTNPKNGMRQVTVSWENAEPGVTLIRVMGDREATRQMAPAATSTWNTNAKGVNAPTYGLWGGTSRKDSSTELVPAGTACDPR